MGKAKRKNDEVSAKPVQRKGRGCNGCLLYSLIALGIVILVTPAYYPNQSRNSGSQSNTTRSTAPAFVTNTLGGFTRSTQRAQTAQPADVYYSLGSTNARSCPRTACDIVSVVESGTRIEVFEAVDGQAVTSGNDRWYRIEIGGKEAYIYSGVVSSSRPSQQTIGGGNNSTRATSIPDPTVSASQPPALQCPSNCDEAVALGWSAEQAGQCPNLDRDNDGVACYGT
jgi:hypothetical protein